MKKVTEYLGRAVFVVALVLCQGLGCGVRPPAGDDDAPAFSIRSLPEVVLDTTVDATERRFLTGMVPVALKTPDFDEGQRFLSRVEAAVQISDCFVSRPRMDWVEFGPDGAGELNEDLTAAVRLSRDSGSECIIIELDPVADRRHVGILPPELFGMDFSDDEVREPVKRMAVRLADEFRPTYLSIGVEMNGYFESNPEDFANYVDLHKETYDVVKAVAPEVQFIAAFNLEALQGFFGDLDEFSNHPPQWFIIDMFEPKLDAVAFSSLPFGFFIRAVVMPDDYLSRIELHTSREILFTEMGWPGDAEDPLHSPISQAEYLAQMMRLIDRMANVRLVVWASMYDADLDTPLAETPEFKKLGLYDHRDEPKPSLAVWTSIHNLPYRP